jgi:hypothetical protein
MSELRFEREILLPAPLEQVFAFFSDAANLERLTPPWLSFQIVSPQPIPMAVGTRIDYRLRLHGIPISWTSEITAWEPPHRFVDEQRKGPYRTWIHEHRFEEIEGGTMAYDAVRYAVLGGVLAAKLFVRPDLEKIFAHRHQVMRELFGGDSGAA